MIIQVTMNIHSTTVVNKNVQELTLQCSSTVTVQSVLEATVIIYTEIKQF